VEIRSDWEGYEHRFTVWEFRRTGWAVDENRYFSNSGRPKKTAI